MHTPLQNIHVAVSIQTNIVGQISLINDTRNRTSQIKVLQLASFIQHHLAGISLTIIVPTTKHNEPHP